MLLLKDIIKMMMILPSSKQDTIDKMEDCIVEGRDSCDYNNPPPVAVKIPYIHIYKMCGRSAASPIIEPSSVTTMHFFTPCCITLVSMGEMDL